MRERDGRKGREQECGLLRVPPFRRAWLCIAACIALLSPASAQTLRFSNHREVAVPEYAVLKMGPFYSSITFSQSVGYRYTSGSGTGIDFLYANERGEIKEDGSDFPMVTTLDLRNYLIISRTMDLDFSIRASYSHYPMDTQEDQFIVDLAQEGIMGNLSTEFEITPYMKGTVFNDTVYRTDYVDTRGLTDKYGGEEYQHLQNRIGFNLDWLMARDMNMGLSVARQDVVPMEDKFKEQQSVSYSETLIWQKMLNALLLVGASASFNQYTYTATTNNRADSAFQQYSVFTTAKLTERTVVSASLGYSIVSLSSPVELPADVNDSQGSAVGAVSVSTKLSRDLDHSLQYSRSQAAGFVSSYDVNDSYSYRLNWKSPHLVAVGIFTDYTSTKPGEEWMGEYSTWSSGITASYPLTSFAALNLSTTYSVRDNSSSGTNEQTNIEWKDNYSTWVSQAGTSFAVTKKVNFDVYAQHVERISDQEDLAYERDTIAANLTYTHQF